MKNAKEFLKSLQQQFELAKGAFEQDKPAEERRLSGFPAKVFTVLYRWQPEPGHRSLRKLAHYKQGFPELDATKISPVQQSNCWNVLTNAILLEGYGNNNFNTLGDVDNPDGDLFHLANNPSMFPPWHGAMLAARHLDVSLLVLLLLWKGDILAQKTNQMETLYFLNEPFRGESVAAREFMEGLRGGEEVFSGRQHRALVPYLEGALGMPGASDSFKEIIQALHDKAEEKKEEWAAEAEMEAALSEDLDDEGEAPAPAVGAAPVAAGAVGQVVVAAGRAPAAKAEVAFPQPKDPFLRMIVPSYTWLEAINAVQTQQFSKAAELLKAETQRVSNPSRMQFIAYLLLLRCWFDLGEMQWMEPTLRLLWREVKKYGNREGGEDLVDDLNLFRWEPALLGELSRLTLAYINRRDDEYACEEITGYRDPLVQHLALSAGLSFYSSKGN